MIPTTALKKVLARVEFVFGWARWIYPNVPGVPAYLLALYVLPQKIFRINGRAHWPVHFTSYVLFPENVRLGRNSTPGGSPGCYIQARNGIEIGANIRVGPGVGLISANHDLDDYDRWQPSAPIRIGDNVWIGMNAVVMPGVSIGDNVVIGANAVVTKDIPPNSIAAGSPCRVIRPKPPYRGIDYQDV